MLKPGDSLHFRDGVCRFQRHKRTTIKTESGSPARIRIPNARVSRTEWGLLRQYLRQRLGWVLEPTIQSPKEAKLTLLRVEEPSLNATSTKPLLLLNNSETRLLFNHNGLRVIRWCLWQIFQTDFMKERKGQCLVFTPIVKPAST